MKHKRVLVTGGAGFIGSAFIRYGFAEFPELACIVNLDLLTYAGNEENCKSVANDPRYHFVRGDIRQEALVQTLIDNHNIDALVHCAAESHVDRSISGPKRFIESNIEGTFSLLEVLRRRPHVHFHHVSTDEVYGSIETGHFTEESSYRPNSPYAATKAASDHLVRAWGHTYNLSTTISHCTNNFGPFQYQEKLIPVMILNCLQKKPLPIYGQGLNIRDWLFVMDHADALWTILDKGKPGEVYDMGGNTEKKNIDLLHELIEIISDVKKESPDIFKSLIAFVPDRPGHDFRYAIDSSKIKRELGWSPKHTFKEALKKTVESYL
jgi:dTDP-glucose 4,6-dehydratase